MEQSRTCIISMRDFRHLAGLTTFYEFEDVISSIDSVDIIELQTALGFKYRDWLLRRLIFKPGIQQLVSNFNPGLKPVYIEKEYELILFLCMHPSDLLYLNGVKNWKDSGAVKVCVLDEFYSDTLQDYKFLLSLLENFDHIFVCLQGSVRTVQDHLQRQCHYMPCAVDTLRFTPFPSPPDRCINIFNMGNRIGQLHNILLKFTQDLNWFYYYDTIPGLLVQPTNFREHRDLIGNIAKRSEFFITYPAKLENGPAKGQSEAGNRYYEACASGAIMIGKAPTAPSFKIDFDWDDAVIELPSAEDEIKALLIKLQEDAERIESIRRNNVAGALLRHDWSYRWQKLLEVIGMDPLPQLDKRHAKLHSYAEMAKDKKIRV